MSNETQRAKVKVTVTMTNVLSSKSETKIIENYVSADTVDEFVSALLRGEVEFVHVHASGDTVHSVTVVTAIEDGLALLCCETVLTVLDDPDGLLHGALTAAGHIQDSHEYLDRWYDDDIRVADELAAQLNRTIGE